MDDRQARVVVHPWLDGERRVTVDGELVGRAVVLEDLREFLALAGLDREALRDPAVVARSRTGHVERCPGGPAMTDADPDFLAVLTKSRPARPAGGSARPTGPRAAPI
ncbi:MULTISPECIES: hypothetical protein [Streptomyces]|uniref:hypothetical protein n=1 Tax=Streptomyces TaxID=1883 RepID=UPI002683E2E2|nr:hypothetical protein [Streptomyces fildesensis]